MKLRFNADTINTPEGYARFVFDLHQRQLTDIFEACEAAKDDRLVFDALREWAATSPQLTEIPLDALPTLVRTLAMTRPAGGPTRAQARDAALRSAAVALCQRFAGMALTRNPASANKSAASVLADVVLRSEDRVNKVLLALSKK